MIRRHHLTLYQSLNLVKRGRLLFGIAVTPLVTQMFTTCRDLHIVSGIERHSMIILMFRLGRILYGELTCGINQKLRRVQKHCRRWIVDNRVRRNLALAMAFHPRLGAHSPLTRLDVNLLLNDVIKNDHKGWGHNLPVTPTHQPREDGV